MANNNIPIIKLKESDIISQSMNIINQNFDTIVNNYDIANFKWEQYSKKITNEIEKLKRHCDNSNIDIARSVDSLNTRIDNITDLNDIQAQINNAIMNANLELTGFISDLAGQQVANAMGGYVKTSTLDNKLKGYVASSAFNTYKSNADQKTALSNLIVTNSKFATIKDNGVDYLMNLDGTKSIYKNAEEYWNAIKNTIDSTGKGLGDEEIFNKFLQKCEETFRTVSTELATISANVGPGSSQVSIIATVKSELEKTSSDDAKDITAAIFARANEEGSSISLDADRLNFNGKSISLISDNNDFNFTLSKSGLNIETTNFNLDEDSLQLTGNLYAKDSEGNITAGVIGENTNDNDIKFFAGTSSIDLSDLNDAPFKVYEDGSVVAGQMSVDVTTGNITFQSNKTWIDSLGKLHATGADISGYISTPFFRITEDNFSDYLMEDDWTDDIYCIDVSKTGTNIQMEYYTYKTPGVKPIYDIYLPVITEDMVGSEFTVLNCLNDRRELSIGATIMNLGGVLTNRGLITVNSDSSATIPIIGYNYNIKFLEIVTVKAIKIPTAWSAYGDYAWILIDTHQC